MLFGVNPTFAVCHTPRPCSETTRRRHIQEQNIERSTSLRNNVSENHGYVEFVRFKCVVSTNVRHASRHVQVTSLGAFCRVRRRNDGVRAPEQTDIFIQTSGCFFSSRVGGRTGCFSDMTPGQFAAGKTGIFNEMCPATFVLTEQTVSATLSQEKTCKIETRGVVT